MFSLQAISQFTPKMSARDTTRVENVIALYEPHLQYAMQRILLT